MAGEFGATVSASASAVRATSATASAPAALERFTISSAGGPTAALTARPTLAGGRAPWFRDALVVCPRACAGHEASPYYYYCGCGTSASPFGCEVGKRNSLAHSKRAVP